MPKNQRYVISTVGRLGAWQTAVFKRRLGPFSAFWPSVLVLNALEATHAATQHDRVATIVRDVEPTDWEKAKRAFLLEDAHARGKIHQLIELSATASPAEDFAALRLSDESDGND